MWRGKAGGSWSHISMRRFRFWNSNSNKFSNDLAHNERESGREGVRVRQWERHKCFLGLGIQWGHLHSTGKWNSEWTVKRKGREGERVTAGAGEREGVLGQSKDSVKVELQKLPKCMQQFVDKDVRQSMSSAMCVCVRPCACMYVCLCVCQTVSCDSKLMRCLHIWSAVATERDKKSERNCTTNFISSCWHSIPMATPPLSSPRHTPIAAATCNTPIATATCNCCEL